MKSTNRYYNETSLMTSSLHEFSKRGAFGCDNFDGWGQVSGRPSMAQTFDLSKLQKASHQYADL